MLIVKSNTELRAQICQWRGSGDSIGFVPTMGALHRGHLSLVEIARGHASKTVASIYVNETQFAPGEDLANYPRDHERDLAKLKSAGCDLVFLPKTMYGPKHGTKINVAGPALGLESDHRPHFFAGVALIVTKLFNLVGPDLAVFGQKDYQQFLTIRQLVRDLNMQVRIMAAPIIREKDGLAMSSRNRYLDKKGRAIAGRLNVIMGECAADIRGGTRVQDATAKAKTALLDAGFERVDYVALADEKTLALLSGRVKNPARLLIAAQCKGVRLIDNCAV